jgi:hypothetical protein
MFPEHLQPCLRDRATCTIVSKDLNRDRASRRPAHGKLYPCPVGHSFYVPAHTDLLDPREEIYAEAYFRERGGVMVRGQPDRILVITQRSREALQLDFSIPSSGYVGVIFIGGLAS